MPKKIQVLLLLFSTFLSHSQDLRFTGNIADTSSGQPLPNVLMMTLRFSDSSLVSFSRTNAKGIFEPVTVPRDTYLVILSHPAFSDRTYLLVPTEKDTAFNFRNVVLPPRSIVLNEIEIIAHKEKSYYKGDTLIFTADSFKTRPNATVEDLLRKLPGFRVDATGKITVQGKQVDQVLVDGDEFFGTDPTIATRNLNATSIENVQVYDKKNESTEEGKEETVKVLNLQMKDDAKKGYFGKVSAASDLQNFYENEVLLNRFKGSRKASLFGLLANTPKQAFNGGDINRYGLSGEQQWQYDEEANSWTSNGESRTGVPQTLKSGFYFNDKLGKKTKLNADYTFNQNTLWQGSETNTQFFLPDTQYVTNTIKSQQMKNQNHAFNMRLTQKIDSLTELIIAPKLRYNLSDNNNVQTDDFISDNEEITRQTVLNNRSHSVNKDANIIFRVNRNFMKKDRILNLIYQPVLTQSTNRSYIDNDFFYFRNQLPDSSVVQERRQENEKTEHNISGTYIEPFTKKFKTEISYLHTRNISTTRRNTYDFTGISYDIFNPELSNNFDNLRLIDRAGTKLIYDVKKFRIAIGSYYRSIRQTNTNISNGQILNLTVNNILPNASFNYRISQGSNFMVNYHTSSQQPDIRQMQPVIDNSDPNRISRGNPDLKPTFSNNINLNYYFYKGISDINFWSGGNYGNTDNQISYSTTYDSLGKAESQPINVDGNYYANLWLGGGFPVLNKLFKIYYNVSANHNNNVSYVNQRKNISQSTSFNPGLTLDKNAENYNINIEGRYSYHIPKTTISVQSNQPYYTYELEGNISVKLPMKFLVSTDGKYTNNGNRMPGFNLNYFIWNASVGKAFLKTENLIVTVNAYDILNQNINNQRYITSNQIVDSKTQIIRRYFLLKVLYKFNNQKTKVEDDEY